MHQSAARLRNSAAVVQYLQCLEKETGTKNSGGLILALLVNYSVGITVPKVTLGKAFPSPFRGRSACATAERVPQALPAPEVSWQG